jgi:NLI interacting factor-like phosphatase
VVAVADHFEEIIW